MVIAFRNHRMLLAGLLIVLAGCSSPTPDLGEVQGRVTMEGQPLANVQVTFAPEKSSEKSPLPISTGTTDRDGSYRLKTTVGTAGAAVGSHRVIVEDIAADAPSEGNGREAQDEKPPAVASVPSRVSQRYSTAAATPLRRDVKLGDNTINFELTR